LAGIDGDQKRMSEEEEEDEERTISFDGFYAFRNDNRHLSSF
jgi:hypothetical protein